MSGTWGGGCVLAMLILDSTTSQILGVGLVVVGDVVVVGFVVTGVVVIL